MKTDKPYSTTILITPADADLIQRVNAKTGAKTIIAAIRHALRFAVEKGKL